MRDLVIELDRHAEMEEPIPSRRYRPIGARRMWMAAGLAVACVLTLGSAVRPLPAMRPLDDVKLANESELITLAGEMFIDERGTLTALDYRTAKPRWRVHTGLGRHLTRDEGDLVLVTGAADDGASAQVWSLAIDIGTGEVRWRLPGLITVVGGVVVSHTADRSTAVSDGSLTVYSIAGQPVWSKAPVAELHTVDPKRQTVLVLESTLGELAEYRVDNGDLISRTVLPELIGAAGLHFLDGEVVAFFGDGRVVSRRGSEFVSSIGIPVGEEGRTDCGWLWCVFSPATYAITLVDKASGALVSDQRWELAIHTDGGIIGIGEAYGQTRQATALFDPVTRRAQPLPGWSPVGVHVDARVVSWRGPLILMSEAPARTYFAVVERTGMRVVGSVPHEHLTGCAATSYLVACRVDPETVKVWQPS